jgi:hypothetical protein
VKVTRTSVAPVTVSQVTSQAVLGVPRRRFLELVNAHSVELRVRRVGKLAIVRVDVWLSWLAMQGAGETSPDIGERLSATDAASSADEILKRLGRRRVAGGGQ